MGDSADRVWHQLDRERSKQMGPAEKVSGVSVGDGALSPVGAPPGIGKGGIHLVQPGPEKKRQDSPPWPSTAATELPVQLSLFG